MFRNSTKPNAGRWIATIGVTAAAVGLSSSFALAAPAESAAAAKPLVVKADGLFDGTQFQNGKYAVLIKGNKIVKVAPADQISGAGARVIDVPGGMILPGFIDMHTHHILNGVPPQRILEHGVTTARDLGGPTTTPTIPNKPYQLGQFYSGPILQAPGGYPNIVFPGSGVEVETVAQARAKVAELAAKGATVITVSLEPGGEYGAPWWWHVPDPQPRWPTLSDELLNAIVTKAHAIGLPVSAYLGDDAGAKRALAADVDEWAHSPCLALSKDTVADAGARHIAIDGTIDTEVKCEAALDNAAALVAAGAKLFYATDMGHPDIPHGADAQEIHMGIHVGFHNGKDYIAGLTDALASATSKAGEYLGVPKLGRIVAGAPADIIVTGADVRAVFKELEYPRVVIKDGNVVIRRSAGQ